MGLIKDKHCCRRNPRRLFLLLFSLLLSWSKYRYHASLAFAPSLDKRQGPKSKFFHKKSQFQPSSPRITGIIMKRTQTVLSGENIDYQANGYGRGQDHLSAFLDEKDIVVYQTGTWLVDGVPVGNPDNDNDDAIISFQYAMVDNIQLIWTHNCEHGVIRGLEVKVLNKKTRTKNENKIEVEIVLDHEGEPVHVQFGPEQLIARLPIVWNRDHNDDKCCNDSTNKGTLQLTELPQWKPIE